MSTPGTTPYEADIRYTTHGVPHIRAADWGGLGYGQGWACARDYLPVIADQIIKVRSERARFFGPGPLESHIASDFGYAALGVTSRAESFRAVQPQWIRELVAGYVAGYNRQVDEQHRAGSLPDWCADAEWIRPIDELDLYAYFGDVAMLGSGRNLAQLIGRAVAPGPDGPAEPSPIEALGNALAASNGWAVGGDVTASGHGMVLANPHFPWYGEARFWECHLTIPGELDVYGAALLGNPGVQMGFTSGLAWAHTFSIGHRFTLYQLALAPDDPTAYRYGDTERAMTPATHSIEVRGDDGELSTLERTLWRTHYGPMLNLPLMGWGDQVAFTYRDANDDNVDVLAQFLEMDRAQDIDQLRDSFTRIKGMPWVNTLAADRSGRVWYADFAATPNLSADAQERFVRRLETDPIAQLLYQSRIALLDGSDPGDEWVEEPGARSPGLVPAHGLPQLERRDWVANSNDSHWLSNPAEPLTGYSPLHGFERRALSIRTRQNIRTLRDLAWHGSLTIDDLLGALFSNASLSAEMLVDQVVERLRSAGTVDVDGIPFDAPAAADLLAAWDRTVGLDSVGATWWREFLATVKMGTFTDPWREAGPLFDVAFDPDDPVATPHTLVARGDGPLDPVVAAVARTGRALEAAGVAPDAPLRDAQWAVRGDDRVPFPGGGEGEGVLNVAVHLEELQRLSLEPTPPRPTPSPGRETTSGLGDGGYQIRYGASFVFAVELTDDGPVGRGVLAYGQTSDHRSPTHRLGTESFAHGHTRPLLFSDEAIEADPELVRVSLVAEGP